MTIKLKIEGFRVPSIMPPRAYQKDSAIRFVVTFPGFTQRPKLNVGKPAPDLFVTF
jgi:hypothetical protein